MGLVVAKSLVDGSHKGKVSVMNLTGNPVKLKTGEVLGLVCPVQIQEGTETGQVSLSELPDHLKPLIDRVSDELSTEEKQQFADFLVEYQDVFVGPDGKFGQSDLVAHTIDTGDAKPIKDPYRKHPFHKKEIIDREVDKMIENRL